MTDAQEVSLQVSYTAGGDVEKGDPGQPPAYQLQGSAPYPQQAPAAYPQQAQTPYPQQAPGPAVAGQPMQQPPVVATQPTVLIQQSVQFRDAPTICTCPNCSNQVTSVVSREIGVLTWLAMGGLCIVGCWLGCCLIPLCVPACKDAIHTCPVCKYQLGRWSALS